MTKQFEYRLDERTVTRRLSDANKVLTGELCLAALVHRTAPLPTVDLRVLDQVQTALTHRLHFPTISFICIPLTWHAIEQKLATQGF